MARWSLNNLGIQLDAVGRREEAFAHRGSRRTLPPAGPGQPRRYLPAMSLNNLGIQLDAVGRWEEAQTAWAKGSVLTPEWNKSATAAPAALVILLTKEREPTSSAQTCDDTSQ